MDWTRRHFSTFTRARDDQRDDIAQQIHDLANTNIAALAPFGITAATLTALQTRISAYVAVIGSPRVARVKISTATEMLDTEFARADMILNDRIDGLIEQFKNSGTSFYADYKNARRIVDTGGPSARPPLRRRPGREDGRAKSIRTNDSGGAEFCLLPMAARPNSGSFAYIFTKTC